MACFAMHVIAVLTWCAILYVETEAARTRQRDVVVMEGDIKVTADEFRSWKREQRKHDRRKYYLQPRDNSSEFATSFYKIGQRGRKRRAVTSIKDRLWENGTIPYVIGANITHHIEQNIVRAMAHWHQHTCIRFVERSNQTDYVLFNPGECGCCSFVGRRGGSQEVTLSPHCAAYGVVVHELGHVIGFWHEHSRPDRDKYIEILSRNIWPEKLENFDKKFRWEIDSLGQPYDFRSIMHYRRRTFSRNGSDTIEPRVNGARIGQRDALSPGDILQASLLYKCPKPDCNKDVFDTDGYINSPSDPTPLDHQCVWIFHVQPGEEITVDLTDFSIDVSTNCSQKYLEIREGDDETGFLIGRLCGNGSAGSIKSGHSLWMKYVSDQYVTKREVAIRYHKTVSNIDAASLTNDSSSSESLVDNVGRGVFLLPTVYIARCTHFYDAKNGRIASPLIPVQYTGSPVQCSWNIDGGANASLIRLNITLPAQEEITKFCVGFIYVLAKRRIYTNKFTDGTSKAGSIIRNGNTLESRRIAGADFYEVERYIPVKYDCQTSQVLNITGSSLAIQWASTVNQPFSINYTIDYDECGLGTHDCEHACRNTVSGYQCSCPRGFQVAPTSGRCLPKLVEFSDKCGSQLTSERGKIRAGTEPVAFCDWHIKPSADNDLRLMLTFHKFKVPSTRYPNGTCEPNYIEVFQGSKMVSKARYCGFDTPAPILTPANSMMLRVHTNIKEALSLPYFTASYISYKKYPGNASECSHRMKAEGSVMSPGYPQQYQPYSMCVWRLSAPRGAIIKLQLKDLDIEQTHLCRFDFLDIRDGRQRTSPLITRLCGNIPPPLIYSRGRHLWMELVTDGTGSGRGFRAVVSSMKINLTLDLPDQTPYRTNKTLEADHFSKASARTNHTPRFRGNTNKIPVNKYNII